MDCISNEPMDVYRSAEKAFEKYLDGYDRENDKVKLKIVHTYGVVNQSTEIARRMKLDNEDISLAGLIGLLHDIGRFEQLKRFDSFQPDTMDHAAYGVKILFESSENGRCGMIREFISCSYFDDIIRVSIARHSDFCLTGISDARTLLHARIIRDADKLDNCRVKLEDDLETFMGASAYQIGSTEISPKVREDALQGRCILSSDRKTLMDYWVSYLAYFYDINFRVSLDIIEENNYVQRIIQRIPYSNPDTKRVMKELEKKITKYVHEAHRL